MAKPGISQTRTLFALACRVEFSIRCSAEVIWTLLADAPGYPGWNSTVTAIDGRIREGERIRIHVPGTERTFAPKVSEVVPGRHMVWTGGFLPLFLGVRTFTLRPESDRSTTFIMEERFSGLMLPLVRQAMPDMGPIFARFASDLDHAATVRGSRSGGVATF